MKATQIFISFVLFSIGILSLQSASSQVVNDHIENRLELVLNTPISSSTANCTLEWKCLDHVQTKKCIQYHNDQWFYFKANDQKLHYVNISGQDCRDLRGVQLMVIDGEACKPENFNILKCISLGTNDDIFVPLHNLIDSKEYLVLVDGYLHDFCEFDIEVSETPKGIPVEKDAITNLKSTIVADYHLELFWHVPDSLAQVIRTYEVFRRHSFEKKSTKVHEVQQGWNAHGKPRLDFVVDEILLDFGAYYYHVIGVNEKERFLVSKSLIDVPRFEQKGLDWLELDLYYSDACKLKISVYDAKKYDLLYWTNFNFTRQNRVFEYFVQPFLDQGITSFRIEVENLTTGEKWNKVFLRK